MLVNFAMVSVFTLPGREVSVETALVDLTMLQGFLGFSSVDGVYWILQIELTFYAVMLVLFVAKQLKRVEVLAAIWLAAASINLVLATHLEIHIPGADTLLRGGYVGFFTAGIMSCGTWNRNAGWRSHMIVLLSSLVQGQVGERSVTIATAMLFAAFYVVAYGRLSVLCVRPLLFLGAISYALYLVHQNIGYIVLRWLYSIGLTPFVAVPCAVVIVLALATGITYLVERPARAKIRGWYATVVTRRCQRKMVESCERGDD